MYICRWISCATVNILPAFKNTDVSKLSLLRYDSIQIVMYFYRYMSNLLAECEFLSR